MPEGRLRGGRRIFYAVPAAMRLNGSPSRQTQRATVSEGRALGAEERPVGLGAKLTPAVAREQPELHCIQ